MREASLRMVRLTCLAWLVALCPLRTEAVRVVKVSAKHGKQEGDDSHEAQSLDPAVTSHGVAMNRLGDNMSTPIPRNVSNDTGNDTEHRDLIIQALHNETTINITEHVVGPLALQMPPAALHGEASSRATKDDAVVVARSVNASSQSRSRRRLRRSCSRFGEGCMQDCQCGYFEQCYPKFDQTHRTHNVGQCGLSPSMMVSVIVFLFLLSVSCISLVRAVLLALEPGRLNRSGPSERAIINTTPKS